MTMFGSGTRCLLATVWGEFYTGCRLRLQVGGVDAHAPFFVAIADQFPGYLGTLYIHSIGQTEVVQDLPQLGFHTSGKI